ncbi:MAG: hypothetical protein Q4C79_00840 [Neisseria sp.]|uniref:hypothetical protein n=1 Tax=Neisseria sp. TaxID=192066 RepID=UPI0026DC5E45|nr:hypothetical protein [Neisseria sp.]MDO4247505.1 hypothetical protein [Neisseria sp.]
MKELLTYVSDMISIFGLLFAFAVFGVIAIIAYHFYPTITVTVVILTSIGWMTEFFKHLKTKNS